MTENRPDVVHLGLRAIFMQSCSHERGPGTLDGTTELESQGHMSRAGDLPDNQVGFVVTLDYTIRNVTEDVAVASGQVAYAVIYDVPPGVKLSDEQAQQYAYNGAIFQVHPYIREHLATMCQRSGLVTYQLPALYHNAEVPPPDRPAPSE